MSLRQELCHRLTLEGSHFVLAVSGGADSIFLAYFFIWLRELADIKLSLAHFNHQLRPEADEMESQALRAFAATWDLSYYEGSSSVRDLAKERKSGIEEAARFARHNFLENTRQEQMAADHPKRPVYLAIGHNADDLLETLLINLGRGSGISGLASMPYFDGRIVRPLLILPRTEIRSFLNTRALSYFEDASNESPEYLRNRIRMELIPLWSDILGYTPLKQAFNLSEHSREESQALDALAKRALEEALIERTELNLIALTAWPSGLYYRVIDLFLKGQLGQEYQLPAASFSVLATKLEQLPCRASMTLAGARQLEICDWYLRLH